MVRTAKGIAKRKFKNVVKIIKKFGLRCLVVYLMDGAADPTMDLWLETDPYVFFDLIVDGDSSVPQTTGVEH